jgi:hypothetical protein
MGKWCRTSLIVAAVCGNLHPVAICLAIPIERRTALGGMCYALFRAMQTVIDAAGDEFMFSFQDLFQWDRFITPTIIKTFYWLVIALTVLFGISGIFSGLAAMAISPFGGFIIVLSSIASVVVGIIFSRIVAEFILIVFRINEHLGAIRDQGPMH